MRAGAVAILVCVAVAPAPAPAALARCESQGGRTLAESARARVYATYPEAGEAGTASRLWGCRKGSRGRAHLADEYSDAFGDEQSYTSVRLRGVRAAFVVAREPADEPATFGVTRRDLATGRAETASVSGRVRLVTSRSGGVAWIERGSVRALVPGGGAKTLDPGPVRPRSLRPAGRTGVAWVRGGALRTARLR